MKSILFYLILIIFTSCNYRNDQSNLDYQDYEETKMSLEEQEAGNPKDFVRIDISYRKNFWDTFIIEGSIASRATVASYKEPAIRFSFYSKTGRLIESKDRVWDEFIGPGETLSINYREPNMRNAVEVRAQLIDIKAK